MDTDIPIDSLDIVFQRRFDGRAKTTTSRTNPFLKEVKGLRRGITRGGRTESAPFHEWNFSIGSRKLDIPYCGSPLVKASRMHYRHIVFWSGYLKMKYYARESAALSIMDIDERFFKQIAYIRREMI